MNYQRVLERIHRSLSPTLGRSGKVADYIPALAKVSPRHFAMVVATLDGQTYSIGGAGHAFSIQSISKLFTLAMVIDREGAPLWRRVGREPSGNPFNSLVQLEREHGIPRNPFINAGAHVITDCLIKHYEKPRQALRAFVRKLSGNDQIDYDLQVARCERETGHTNRALANFIKSFGNLAHEVDVVLDVYFHQCALEMSCLDLARAGLFLANGGIVPGTGERVLGARLVKRLNALLLTCGTYDACGDFAYRVGLPCKSGVGGGILGVLPGELCVAVWSPALDKTGNSLAGTKALELFTTFIKRSIF